MARHEDAPKTIRMGHVEIALVDGKPLVSRHAVYPPELDLAKHTVLAPEASRRRVESSILPSSAQQLLIRLIESGRVLDWRGLGIGYALDYSRILNRQLDVQVCNAIANDQIDHMIDAGVNCILAPDNSGGPIGAFYGMRYFEKTGKNPLFVRLSKGHTLTMDTTVGVNLASYTKVDGAVPVMSTLTAEVGDFPQGIKLNAALVEDIFDTGAMAAAVHLITEQLQEHQVDIQLTSAFAPFSKLYASNDEVFDRLGIWNNHAAVGIEGLVPMTADRQGIIQVSGVEELLTLSRVDTQNGYS